MPLWWQLQLDQAAEGLDDLAAQWQTSSSWTSGLFTAMC
jgi:hypothetical protein